MLWLGFTLVGQVHLLKLGLRLSSSGSNSGLLVAPATPIPIVAAALGLAAARLTLVGVRLVFTAALLIRRIGTSVASRTVGVPSRIATHL